MDGDVRVPVKDRTGSGRWQAERMELDAVGSSETAAVGQTDNDGTRKESVGRSAAMSFASV